MKVTICANCGKDMERPKTMYQLPPTCFKCKVEKKRAYNRKRSNKMRARKIRKHKAKKDFSTGI